MSENASIGERLQQLTREITSAESAALSLRLELFEEAARRLQAMAASVCEGANLGAADPNQLHSLLSAARRCALVLRGSQRLVETMERVHGCGTHTAIYGQ